MEHKKYKDLLELYMIGELSLQNAGELKAHIEQCRECKAEYESFENLKTGFSKIKTSAVDDALLNEARDELRTRLRIERNRKSYFAVIKEKISDYMFTSYRTVLGAAALFALGLFAGYLFFNTSDPDYILQPELVQNESEALGQNVSLNNVRIIESDLNTGNIEVEFDAVRPVKIKGNLDDAQIQRVLMYSMLKGENPGARLNSINVMGSKPQLLDEEIKAALTSVVKYDGNPGVRREALKLLGSIPYDEEIKNSYLYVLLNDTSSGMRIEAINSLLEASRKGHTFSQEDINLFKEKVQQDENNYIRLRAKNVLKEYN